MSTQENAPHYDGDQQAGPRQRPAERKLSKPTASPSLEQPLPEFLQGARRRSPESNSQPLPPVKEPIPIAEGAPIAPQQAPGLLPVELEELEREIMRTRSPSAPLASAGKDAATTIAPVPSTGTHRIG